MSGQRAEPAAVAAPCARAVVMVRPACFYSNPETAATNAFQRTVTAAPADTLAAAQREFDHAAESLAAAGVEVMIAAADPAADTPDAIFPNNWFSTHADGRVLLYPMATPNRRRERRPDLVTAIAARHGRRVTRLVDLSGLEADGLIVEGTGSLVFDHCARVAYAALSPRTHAAAVAAACRELACEPVSFRAFDGSGREVYHTNVVLAVGPALAVFATGMVAPDADRRAVVDALVRGGKTVLEISAEQVGEFAGNLLFLEGGRAGPLVAVSRRAWACLAPSQRALIERHAQPVLCAIDTIEHVGGGGIRCMLAESFLPRAD